MRHQLIYADNGEGWEIALKQTIHRQLFRPSLRPLVIVPGYGMNAHIFSFHPSGLSMEDFFAKEGFEVWSVELRNQGKARRKGGSRLASLQDLAVTDLSAAFDAIAKATQTRHKAFHVIGASLGGTLLYIHQALVAEHRVASHVALGAPLRWEKVHPLLKLAFKSPRLVGLLPLRYTRTFVRLAWPALHRIPGLLDIYLHKNLVDIRFIDQMIPTVDDPNRLLNRQIAEWIAERDLILGGVDITQAQGRVATPLLCVLANADGIVPPETARSALQASSSPVRDLLVVGDEKMRFAHADLFVSRVSHQLVFAPIAAWLQSREADLSSIGEAASSPRPNVGGG